LIYNKSGGHEKLAVSSGVVGKTNSWKMLTVRPIRGTIHGISGWAVHAKMSIPAGRVIDATQAM
jgi:hypothetical protein